MYWYNMKRDIRLPRRQSPAWKAVIMDAGEALSAVMTGQLARVEWGITGPNRYEYLIF